LIGLAVDQNDQLTEVTRSFRQPSLAEARIDATLEMRHGGPDVFRGELNLISSRTGTCHLTNVGVSTPTAPEDSASI
jgi:hypothetical protein